MHCTVLHTYAWTDFDLPVTFGVFTCDFTVPFVFLLFWSKGTLGNPLYKRFGFQTVRKTLFFKNQKGNQVLVSYI